MKNSPFRSTFLFLGAFVLLLGFVLFFANDSVDKRSKESRLMRPYLTSSQQMSLDEFRFLSGERQLVFSDSDGIWMVSDGSDVSYPVDDQQLELVLASVREFPKGKTVSRNEENWPDYGILETSDRVQLFVSDTPVLEFRIGSQGTNSQSFYAKRDSYDSVFQVKSDLSRLVKYDLDFWLAKDIIAFPSEEMMSYTLRLGEDKWMFTQTDGMWSYDLDGVPFELQGQESFSNYLAVLDNLSAATVRIDQSSLVRVDHAFSITKDDGSELVVSIQQDEGTALLQVTDVPYLMVYPADITVQLRPDFLEPLLAEAQDLGEQEEGSDEESSSPEELSE